MERPLTPLTAGNAQGLQKSVGDLAQNNTAQNKTIVKLQRKQKKAMVYSNTVKQFPLFEASKK